MDILIKGMEMPKTCRRCMEMGIPVRCRVMEQEAVTAVMSGYDRPSDCPLVALPEHGDLIDRDALIKDSWASYMLKKKNDDSSRVQYDTLMGYEIRRLLEDAPTIVEATE